MATSNTLSSKEQALVGVGAAIAAGCQPCTRRLIQAARAAGACERGIIRSIVKDSVEAEDVLQEVFERAHHNVEQLRAEAALTTWLFRISTHVSVDHLRKRERRPLVVEPFDLDDLCPDEPEPSLQVLVEQREMSACVQRSILDLQIDYRTVILLHDVEGLTAAEIALVLDLTLANVKMRLHRARASLEAALELGCEFSCDCRGVTVCAPKTK